MLRASSASPASAAAADAAAAAAPAGRPAASVPPLPPLPLSPPPLYEEVVLSEPSAARPPPLFDELHVPARYAAASAGRNSIRYAHLPPLYDTTRLFFIDNKSADIKSLNYQNDHSDYLTSIVQNSDFTPLEAANQSVELDERSRWGVELKTLLHTNLPNITAHMFSDSFRVRLMSARRDDGSVEYDWFTLTLPEGNYSETTVLDLMNNAVSEWYLKVGRQNGVREEDIGVKFDTRNFRLGYDPETGLVMPGTYTHEAVHADVVLLPGCAVDFTHTRLNNLLGIRKRFPYQEGFVLKYEDLRGGNIPALLDLEAFSQDATVVRPLREDPRGRSYHVGEDPEAAPTDTAYRSWYLAYNYGDPASGVRASTLLTTGDVTCGVEQMYWSFPDLAVEPATFKASQRTSDYPVVGTDLLPLVPRSFYNAQAVYSQWIAERTNQTHVFNRFPENQILARPPAPTITSICENVPRLTDHGVVPVRNRLTGVQRVTLTDARRRTCPYVYKSLGIAAPRVLSSRTF
ncbi:III [Ovine adenovirus 8]|uniref:Penton protein n=1 Tax=Ovine adenovirus 8 TaxID=2601527 RepID=A0A5B8MAS8_9ADEN|nr:III [Ovine adenovirus 8]QDZ17463.1 III [Ovine adenovirus 8]